MIYLLCVFNYARDIKNNSSFEGDTPMKLNPLKWTVPKTLLIEPMPLADGQSIPPTGKAFGKTVLWMKRALLHKSFEKA